MNVEKLDEQNEQNEQQDNYYTRLARHGEDVVGKFGSIGHEFMYLGVKMTIVEEYEIIKCFIGKNTFPSTIRMPCIIADYVNKNGEIVRHKFGIKQIEAMNKEKDMINERFRKQHESLGLYLKEDD